MALHLELYSDVCALNNKEKVQTLIHVICGVVLGFGRWSSGAEDPIFYLFDTTF